MALDTPAFSDLTWPKQGRDRLRTSIAELPAAILPFRRFSPNGTNPVRLPPPQVPWPHDITLSVASIKCLHPNMPGSPRTGVAVSAAKHVQPRLAHDTGSLGIIAGLIVGGLT